MGADNHPTVVPTNDRTPNENPFRSKGTKFVKRKLEQHTDRGGVVAMCVRYAAKEELKRRNEL